MNDRFLFICCALLAFANVALGDGVYQRTRDGKTLVWNNHPQAGDEATWSGDRDREGYAGGFGTLTWYTGFAEPALYARYWGNMIRGKLSGRVNVHSKRKTHHAIFADGVRMTRWAAGPAPYRFELNRHLAAEVAQKRAKVAKQNTTREPEAPAEGPGPGTTEWSQSASDIDDSLRVLVWPPRSLRAR